MDLLRAAGSWLPGSTWPLRDMSLCSLCAMECGEWGAGGVRTGPSSLAWKCEWMGISDGEAVSVGVWRECQTPRSSFEGLPGKRVGWRLQGEAAHQEMGTSLFADLAPASRADAQEMGDGWCSGY